MKRLVTNYTWVISLLIVFGLVNKSVIYDDDDDKARIWWGEMTWDE